MSIFFYDVQRGKKEAQFDVYLSYNQTDRDKVVEISKLLLKEDAKLRIFEVEQHLDKEAAFQEDILNTMLLSCRSGFVTRFTHATGWVKSNPF